MGVFEFDSPDSQVAAGKPQTDWLDIVLDELTLETAIDKHSDVHQVSVVDNGAAQRTNLTVTIPADIRNSLGITDDHSVLMKPVTDDCFLVRRV